MKGIWFRLAKLIKEADWINCIPENIKSGVTVYNEYTRQDVTGTAPEFDLQAYLSRGTSTSWPWAVLYNKDNCVSLSGSTLTINLSGPYYVALEINNSNSFTVSNLTQVSGLSGNVDDEGATCGLYTGEGNSSVTLASGTSSGMVIIWRG